MNSNTPVFRIASAAIAAFTLTIANANATDYDAAIRQPAVVVTALRRPQNADTALASITVITRPDPELSQPPALIRVPGPRYEAPRMGQEGVRTCRYRRGSQNK